VKFANANFDFQDRCKNFQLYFCMILHFTKRLIAMAVLASAVSSAVLFTYMHRNQAEPDSSFDPVPPVQAAAQNTNKPMAITTFRGHLGGVVYIAFSPDSKLIASASNDNTIKLWDPKTGNVARTFSIELTEENHDDYPFAIVESSSKLSFSQDGKILTLGNGNGSIISWQVDTGKLVQKLRRQEGSSRAAFSADGNFFAHGFAVEPFQPFLPEDDMREGVNIEKFVDSYNRWSSNPRAGGIKIWDVKTGKQVNSLSNTGFSFAIALSPNNQFLVTTNLGGVAQLWDLNSKRLVREWSGFRTVAISSDSQLIASDSCNRVKVWNLVTGKEIHSFPKKGCDLSLAFSSDSKILAIGSTSENVIRLWDVKTGRETITLPSEQVFSIAISPNGELIVSSSLDGTIRVWMMP
jgi:WD40 repeat protein